MRKVSRSQTRRKPVLDTLEERDLLSGIPTLDFPQSLSPPPAVSASTIQVDPSQPSYRNGTPPGPGDFRLGFGPGSANSGNFGPRWSDFGGRASGIDALVGSGGFRAEKAAILTLARLSGGDPFSSSSPGPSIMSSPGREQAAMVNGGPFALLVQGMGRVADPGSPPSGGPSGVDPNGSPPPDHLMGPRASFEGRMGLSPLGFELAMNRANSILARLLDHSDPVFSPASPTAPTSISPSSRTSASSPVEAFASSSSASASATGIAQAIAQALMPRDLSPGHVRLATTTDLQTIGRLVGFGPAFSISLDPLSREFLTNATAGRESVELRSTLERLGQNLGPAAETPVGEGLALHEAGLITDFLPFDRASLEESLAQFLTRIKELGPPLKAEGSLIPTPVLIATAFLTFEAARRWRKRRSFLGFREMPRERSSTLHGFS